MLYEDLREDGETEQVARPPDVGGDELPFGHLSSRRFEVLVYRLKCAAHLNQRSRVRLMQGTGERGRDVIVHTVDGVLAEIVQCKNQLQRMTMPDVKHELVKIALHNYLDPSLLGEGPVTYELWCPPGLTEPAQDFLDKWPTSWTRDALGDAIKSAKASYATLRPVDMDDAARSVFTRFPTLLTPKLVHGVDATAQIRRSHAIYADFFSGSVQASLADVEAAVESLLLTRGFRRGDDDYINYLNGALERLKSAPRSVLGGTIVFGLDPELLRFMEREELREYGTNLLRPVLGSGKVFLFAATKYVRRLFQEIQPKLDVRGPQFFYHVVSVTLESAAIAQITEWGGLASLDKKGPFSGLADKGLIELFEHSLKECVQRDLAGHFPTVECTRIAEAARADFTRNGRLIQESVDAIRKTVPREVLVVATGHAWWQDKFLLDGVLHVSRVVDGARPDGASREEE